MVWAGVVQWQNGSFPSCTRGFDSLHPLHDVTLVKKSHGHGPTGDAGRWNGGAGAGTGGVVAGCRRFEHTEGLDLYALPASVYGRTQRLRLADKTLNDRFITSRRQDRSSPPTQATPLRPSCRYIGGLTPCVPTVTRGVAKFPLASLCAMTNTCRPGFRSARVAGAKVTICVRCGTCTVNVPSL